MGKGIEAPNRDFVVDLLILPRNVWSHPEVTSSNRNRTMEVRYPIIPNMAEEELKEGNHNKNNSPELINNGHVHELCLWNLYSWEDSLPKYNINEVHAVSITNKKTWRSWHRKWQQRIINYFPLVKILDKQKHESNQVKCGNVSYKIAIASKIEVWLSGIFSAKINYLWLMCPFPNLNFKLKVEFCFLIF